MARLHYSVIMIDDGSRWFGLLVTAFVVLVPTAMGVGMIAAAVRRWRQARYLAQVGRRTKAVVVENQQRSGSEGRITFIPVVRFVTTAGQEIRTPVEDLGGYDSHLTGTEYEIVYDPDRPQTAMVPTGGTGGVVGAVIFALVCFGFAAAALFMSGTFLLDTDPFAPGFSFG
jgi:uncharacterized protein DUF3592